jgi:hypothetical protein
LIGSRRRNILINLLSQLASTYRLHYLKGSRGHVVSIALRFLQSAIQHTTVCIAIQLRYLICD